MKNVLNFIVSIRVTLLIIIIIGILQAVGLIVLANMWLLLGCEFVISGFSIALNNNLKPNRYAGTIAWIVFILLSIGLNLFFFTMGFE